MTRSLGIDIGAEVTTAVIVDDLGQLTVLELGEGRVATASVVFRGGDGSTMVGDAAAVSADDGELTSDPMRVLASESDPRALRPMIAHVLGRAVAAVGEAPDLVGLVHSDDWDVGARERLIEVARSAGAMWAVPVSDRVAVRNRVDVAEPVAALAAGAAVTALTSVGPIVTREDMGEDRPAPPRSVQPAVTTVSVFDAVDDEPMAASDPASAPPPAASAVADPTMAMASVRTSPPPRRPVSAPPRSILLLLLLLAGVVVAALVVLFLLAGGGSDEEPGAVASSTVTTSTIATTTTPPSSTATTSSTSTTSSSTTSTTSSTTSSTSSTSTTSVPVAAGTPGPVTLVETGLVLDVGTVLRFGDEGDLVLNEIAGAIGDPDSDSGFFEVAFCFSARSRFVRWGDLEVVIGEDSEGATTFTQWYVDGVDEPPGLVTIDGLGVGATLGFLEVNYGGALDMVAAFEDSESGLFAVTNSGSGGTLVGITESLEPEAEIGEMWAGDECTRVFT